MGNYNPSAPLILGEEWVGIREETTTFTPGVPNVAIGHEVTLTATRTLDTARFYLNDLPSGKAEGTVMSASIYPAGTADQSGPVKRVVIPCNNGSVTAGSVSFPVTFQNSSTFAEAVASPGDNKYIRGWVGASSTTISKIKAYFAVNSFSSVLSGKRILGVNLLYSIGSLAYVRAFDVRPSWFMALGNDAANLVFLGQGDDAGVIGNLVTGTQLGTALPATRLYLGSFNSFWHPTLAPTATTERLPWTYTNLAKMEISATNRFGVLIQGTTTGDGSVASSVEYLALEVFYCEEKRVAFGGTIFGSTTGYQPWVNNTNQIVLRTIAEATSPVATAGNYEVVVGLESVGYAAPTESPKLQALRELKSFPPHEGVQVTVPFPLNDNAVGDVITDDPTSVLPQISLHTFSATLTEPHVYGRQAQAPVYGTITATQEIADGAAGGARSYPQARFYARRYGDTTVSLTLDSPSIPASSASISVLDFDALEELVDGWKEVTLRFTAAPSMGTGTNPQWRFSATGETAGNQWQVLGLTAPALSGTPGNPTTPVPTAHQLTTATYGAPSAGATINMGWLSPSVLVTTDDQTADAVLMFSTDPDTPTGFATSVQTQTLTSVDPTCFANSCVPTGLRYNRLTWTAITNPIAVSGFGSYEIQRYDPVDGDFFTIMAATDVTLNTFNDYEARVGIPSVYRIRSTNLHDFVGQWSPQVTGTVTSPGVIGGDTALLLFTTNSRQDGSSNLAYSAAWMSNPNEEFTWPESGSVVLQEMYGKDYPTAFRPLERGGEQFNRTVLVNASGIPEPVTARGFASLRDMAWDDVPYICVRDELGERWYATVVVPSGSVRRMIARGQLCMASVNIIETTDTPYPVDPS